MEHFGVKLINKGKSFKLTKEEFALINPKPSLPFFPTLAKNDAYIDAAGSAYREEWCKDYRESCFSIDFFRALDTTRIYVWKRKLLDGIEYKLISNFPNQFRTNRIGGDITDVILALATMNRRNLL